jgi:tRNA G18 (ribose-2'-O)-methylase SpoU
VTPKAGTQLSGDALYAQQQERRHAVQPGPRIIAVGLRTPSNQGSIFRIADSAGARELVFVDLEPNLEPRLVRTARGANALVPFRSTSLASLLEHANALAPLVAIEITSSSQSLFETALPAPCSLVVGGERYGIPQSLLALCERAVHIPMYGLNGSMNVTHALAITIFEWRRQHG